MSALIDADFQKVLDAINDAVPMEGVADRFDCPEPHSAMAWDFGLEAIAGSYGATERVSSPYRSIPNTEEAFDHIAEDHSLEGSKVNETADSLQELREELSKIQAEVQELKKMVEAVFEIYGQRITSTEKYIDDLLPWTQEVHGAIEQLTERSGNANKASQDASLSVEELLEKI
ncbi:hypothetical protein DIS24_g5925 [Lasiodiplodia hormozganensis]|uniref:Uncharacterized protein n=1 Tax=Lasiodiplodia hormozganensis TaxID=869390 RepID=A0AA40CWU6_9PEZI|nr:hypothetical protein DIS24_g5925 [Lasiodiplodia hormozganensis]